MDWRLVPPFVLLLFVFEAFEPPIMGDGKELYIRRLSEVTYWKSRSKAPRRDQKHTAKRSQGFVDDKRRSAPTHVVQAIRTPQGVYMKESRLKQG